MNAKNVLNKILTMLSSEKEEVKMTYAKLADGTVVESPTFDLGEPVEVVTEDGKVPAPDGEHELALKDSEGNDILIKIETEGGIITERENVELPAAEAERVEEEMESIAGDDMGGGEADSAEVSAQPLPEDMMKKMEEMAYRIEEMEKKFGEFEKQFPKMEEEVVDKEADEVVDLSEELPKLDGAPVEDTAKVAHNFGKKVVNAQSSFLSKLYK
jgi:chaperonin cofactor prefoldin